MVHLCEACVYVSVGLCLQACMCSQVSLLPLAKAHNSGPAVATSCRQLHGLHGLHGPAWPCMASAWHCLIQTCSPCCSSNAHQRGTGAPPGAGWLPRMDGQLSELRLTASAPSVASASAAALRAFQVDDASSSLSSTPRGTRQSRLDPSPSSLSCFAAPSAAQAASRAFGGGPHTLPSWQPALTRGQAAAAQPVQPWQGEQGAPSCQCCGAGLRLAPQVAGAVTSGAQQAAGQAACLEAAVSGQQRVSAAAVSLCIAVPGTAKGASSRGP